MISSAYVLITNRCNLNCSYCYEREREGDMSWATMRQLIEMMVGNYQRGEHANVYSHFNINFFGGEPFLNWPVMKKTFEYIETIRQERGLIFSISIITNGMIWNEEIHEFLKKQKAFMGHRLKFQVSMDGCEETHNKSRPTVSGGDSYKLIVENVKKFRQIIPELQIRETLLPQNVDNFYDDYVALSSLANVVQMTPIVEENWLPVIDKTKEQFQKIYDLFFQQLEKHPCRFLSLLSSPLIEANERSHGCYSPGDYKGCHAGHQLIGVTVNGDIYPCHRFVAYRRYFDYKMGDVWSGIDQNSEKLKEIHDMHGANPECAKCKNHTCIRCYATNKYIEGQTTAQPRTGFCELMKMNQEFVNKYSDKLFFMSNNTLQAFSDYKSPTTKRRGLIMENGEKILAPDAEDLLVQSMVKVLKVITELQHQNTEIIKYLSIIAKAQPGIIEDTNQNEIKQ